MEQQERTARAIELIARERDRQIHEYGWHPEYDDKHLAGELAQAAACYAAPIRVWVRSEHPDEMSYRDAWPWELHYDRRRHDTEDGQPIDPQQQTVRERLALLAEAGALVVAEIERLHRRIDAVGEPEAW